MAEIAQTTSAGGKCDTRLPHQMGNPCVAPAPEAVFAALNSPHGAGCAEKAWKIGVCVGGNLVFHYEADVNGAPSGTPLAGDWVLAVAPSKVFVCPAPATPPPPITVTGADCAGAPLAVTGTNLIQTVPHPNAVQKVQLCKSTDNEIVQLCTDSGSKIVLQYDTVSVPPLLLSAWNTSTNAAYTGAIAALKDCATEKVDITEGEDYCLAGVNYTRVDGLAVDTGLPVWTMWLNDAGVPVAAPVSAVKGVCQECAPKPCCPRDVFYQSGGALVLSPTQQATTFDNYPNLTADVPSTTSTADLYLLAIEHGVTGLWDTAGGLNTNIFTAVPWANAQAAVDLFLTNAGFPAGSVIVGDDGVGQPTFVFDANFINTGDIAWWVGDINTYTAKIKATLPFAGTVIAGVECRMIKLIDTLQCDGTYTTEALWLDNRRIDGFDPAKLVAECPCKASVPVGVVSSWG